MSSRPASTELAAGADARRVPSRQTIKRHFARLGITGPVGQPARRPCGRFEAAARNNRWIGDGMQSR